MPASGDSLRELVAVMDRLRSPGGCPWDARQTHASLVEYLIEEAYETVEAIEAEDGAGLREELGDLLLQVVFHARIAQEDAEAPWDIDDVAQGIVDKLVRRHPHVFAPADDLDPSTPAQVSTAEHVESRWHALKAQEKGRASVTEGIPESLPALVRASKMLARSQHLDVSAPTVDIMESVADTKGLGDLLLGIVAASRTRGWDAEAALRDAVRRYGERVQQAERP
jgi:XTP/dITP diphosphohydrolase